MLIHIVSKIVLPMRMPIDLVDVTIEELGLVLKGGQDIIARQPYPNKYYWVACKKSGRKAVNGLLVESMPILSAYTVRTRWALTCAVNDLAAGTIITHRVEHIVVDEVNDVFDCVSDSMFLWSGGKNWDSRWPDCYAAMAPVKVEPTMCVEFEGENRAKRVTIIQEEFSSGLLIERSERIFTPVIERKRLSGCLAEQFRLPAMEHAFCC